MKNRFLASHLRILFHAGLLLSCSILSASPNAQRASGSDQILFTAHIKTLDEFIQRINGKELYPLSVENDSDKVRTTRFSLFDMELLDKAALDDSTLVILENFVNSLARDSIEIQLQHPVNWIEATSVFSLNHIEYPLTLKMQLEKDSADCWHWHIFDVDGLYESGLLDDSHPARISPVEHELNFSDLSTLFAHGFKNISSIRKSNLPVNRLSFFLGLASSGALTLKYTRNVEFHCRQVPDFYFIAKELNRIDTLNSGWLIVSLLKNK